MKMKSMAIVPAALVIVMVGLAILTPADTVIAAESSATAQVDPMQFAKGAKTWADNCARCHNMRDPKSLRDDQWRAAVAHMRVRAGLTRKEVENVLRFLQQSN